MWWWVVSSGALSVKQAFGFDPTLLMPLSVKLAEALVSVLTAGTIMVVSELRGHWPSTDVPEGWGCGVRQGCSCPHYIKVAYYTSLVRSILRKRHTWRALGWESHRTKKYMYCISLRTYMSRDYTPSPGLFGCN